LNVPSIIACPLLLQSITQWQKSGALALQSVVLYSFPELDGAIDTVILGGLVGDKIALIPERVRKLTNRITGWVTLRKTSNYNKKIAISVYGFPPNVGAVGTAALLDVPHSLEPLLYRLHEEGYNVGDWSENNIPSSSSNETISSSGESLIAALSVLCENPVITRGAKRMQESLDNKIQLAIAGDVAVAVTLAKSGGGLGGAKVHAVDISSIELEQMLGKYMMSKVNKVWYNQNQRDITTRKNSAMPGLSGSGEYVVAGLELGNIFLFVQPLLGIEGDPMRLLFERNLTPHPQYCATYKYVSKKFQADAIIHLG
jgi:magnesium chelatase subunit H